MLEKVFNTLKKKENIYVFLIFLFFFPLKTQLQNIFYFIIDFLITEGNINKVYSFDYTGNLAGCLNVTEYKEATKHFNWFQKQGVFYLGNSFSLIAFLILYKRWKNDCHFGIFHWLLLIVSCFSILNAIEGSYFLLLDWNQLTPKEFISTIIPVSIFLLIGLFIFLKICGLKQRIQIIFIGIPVFYFSMYFWFKLIGPEILPRIL